MATQAAETAWNVEVFEGEPDETPTLLGKILNFFTGNHG